MIAQGAHPNYNHETNDHDERNKYEKHNHERPS